MNEHQHRPLLLVGGRGEDGEPEAVLALLYLTRVVAHDSHQSAQGLWTSHFAAIDVVDVLKVGFGKGAVQTGGRGISDTYIFHIAKVRFFCDKASIYCRKAQKKGVSGVEENSFFVYFAQLL